MSCTRCGACCFPYAIGMDPDEDARRWLTYHGLILQDMEDGRMAIFGHSRCEMLVMNEDGTTSCAVYSNRPAICQKYLCKTAKEETEPLGGN